MKIDIPTEQAALDLLEKDCLSCRKCAIGGRRLDGEEWKSKVELERLQRGEEYEPISNVFSSMVYPAEVMVVGQNPGAEEAKFGFPFVGPSGKMFDEAMKRLVGLERKDLYVTNVVKCYTNGNRKPTQAEVDACRDFLDLEVKLVQPKVVIALGSFAFKAMTGMSGIMKHCGEVVASPRYMVPVVVMLHPSPFNTNHPERKEMFEDGMRARADFLEK